MKLGMASVILALFLSPASAHTRHHHVHPMVAGLGIGLAHMIAGKPVQKDWYNGPGSMPRYTAAPFDDAHVVGSGYPDTLDIPPKGWPTQRHSSAEVVPHPAGCPSRAFCGCGAAAYLGLHDRSLWLAASWFRFPRAEPAPGMVAVRQHHVFVIVQYEGGGRVLAYDANSGGHQTRVHEVSLSGYRVVNPHASQYARL